MFDFQFECDNTITLIDRPPVVSREIKPVWAEELNILGIDRFYKYPHECEAPLLWSCANRYYYRGDKVFEVKYIDCDTPPEIKVFSSLYQSFEPVKIGDLVNRNKALMDRLIGETKETIRDTLQNDQFLSLKVVCCFSGGKDSAVLLDLMAQSCDDFVCLFENTGMEFSETVEEFGRISKKYDSNRILFLTANPVKKPHELWDLIGYPTRVHRWCCRVCKSGPGTQLISKVLGDFSCLYVTGQRAEESVARSKYSLFARGELNNWNFRPILKWSSAEVWLYLLWKIKIFNTRYRKGSKRVGCVLCPLSFRAKNWIESHSGGAVLQNLRAIVEKNYYRENFTEGNWVGGKDGLSLKNNPPRFFDDGQKIHKLAPFSVADWLIPAGLNPCEDLPKAEKKYIIKSLYCVSCGLCVGRCSAGAISIIDGVLRINPNKCCHCRECLKADPKRGDVCFAYSRRKIPRKETVEWCKNNGFANLLSLPKAAEL